MRNYEIDKTLQEIVTNSTYIFKKSSQGADALAKIKNEKISTEGLRKYELMKPQIAQDFAMNVKQAFAKKFSAAELKYLIDLAKNSLNIKFRLFVNSNEYNEILNKPYKQASELFNELKKSNPK